MSEQVPPPPGDFPPPPPPGGPPPPPPPPGGFGGPPPGYTPYGSGPTPLGPPAGYAGFGARLVAYLIDTTLVGMLSIPAVIALTTGPTRITECTIDASGDITGFGQNANGLCEVPTGATIALTVVLGLLALVGALAYHAMLEGGPKGQTVGKMALRIKVADASTGGPIGPGRAIGRWLFASFISGNLCLLGYLWNIWDPRGQTWHDKVTSAVVIRT